MDWRDYRDVSYLVQWYTLHVEPVEYRATKSGSLAHVLTSYLYEKLSYTQFHPPLSERHARACALLSLSLCFWTLGSQICNLGQRPRLVCLILFVYKTNPLPPSLIHSLRQNSCSAFHFHSPSLDPLFFSELHTLSTKLIADCSARSAISSYRSLHRQPADAT